MLPEQGMIHEWCLYCRGRACIGVLECQSIVLSEGQSEYSTRLYTAPYSCTPSVEQNSGRKKRREDHGGSYQSYQLIHAYIMDYPLVIFISLAWYVSACWCTKTFVLPVKWTGNQIWIAGIFEVPSQREHNSGRNIRVISKASNDLGQLKRVIVWSTNSNNTIMARLS